MDDGLYRPNGHSEAHHPHASHQSNLRATVPSTAAYLSADDGVLDRDSY